MSSIEIVEFKEEFADDFARLNYDWISKFYEIEEHDHDQLDNAFEYIVKPGGQIFFAIVNGAVAGTVALIYIDEVTFELAKMAVSDEFKGLGLGDKLMDACIEYSQENGVSTLVLESNTKQVAAINLYRKHGFVETPLDPNSLFKRANIRMELAINRSSM